MRSMWAPGHRPSIVSDFDHRRLDLFLDGAILDRQVSPRNCPFSSIVQALLAAPCRPLLIVAHD